MNALTSLTLNNLRTIARIVGVTDKDVVALTGKRLGSANSKALWPMVADIIDMADVADFDHWATHKLASDAIKAALDAIHSELVNARFAEEMAIWKAKDDAAQAQAAAAKAAAQAQSDLDADLLAQAEAAIAASLEVSAAAHVATVAGPRLPRPGSKLRVVLDLMLRDGGALTQEICDAVDIQCSWAINGRKWAEKFGWEFATVRDGRKVRCVMTVPADAPVQP